MLADETGGFAAVNSNDLAGAFDRVVRDNRSYYMLGYYPANQKRDDGFRRIEVRVNRPGLQVRARKGYASPRKDETPAAPRLTKAEGSPELADALSRPIQTSGLTLQANAASLKGAAPNTSVVVAITVDGAGFTFAEKDGWIEDKLEISVRAIDPKGTIRGSEHFDLNIRIRPESRRILIGMGFRAISKIDLPPGRYRLHIGARESGAGAVGTIFTDLEVPDFANAGALDEQPHAHLSRHRRHADRSGGAIAGSAADRAVDGAGVPIERRADRSLPKSTTPKRPNRTPIDITASILATT